MLTQRPYRPAPPSSLLVCTLCGRDHVAARIELLNAWPQHCGSRMRLLHND